MAIASIPVYYQVADRASGIQTGLLKPRMLFQLTCPVDMVIPLLDLAHKDPGSSDLLSNIYPILLIQGLTMYDMHVQVQSQTGSRSMKGTF